MTKHVTRRAVFAALAAAVLGAAAIPAAQATYPGTTEGRLAFGITVDGNTDVYSVLPDGQALHRLTEDPGFDACPAYSADGKWIAWCGSEGSPAGRFAIWVMKQDGTEKRRLTNADGRATFPDFSPDGSTIAYNGPDDAGNVDVRAISVAGGTPVRLTDSTGFDAYPAYSPDGSEIAFVSSRTGINQVWVMDADGSDQRQLTFDPVAKDQVPDWSPDGSKIAYVTKTSPIGGDIWVMSADGSDPHAITSGPAKLGAAWSPEGTQIATSDVATRTTEIVPAGGGEARVVRQLGIQFVPGWQPRGDRRR